MHTRASLAHDLRSLGIAEGDVVMIHASVRSVGEVAGGPDQIHLAVSDAVGPSGTIFMYASCPRYVDEVGRGDMSPEEEAEIMEKLPPFDPLTARSARDNGALVELLRTWPGTRVNDHPARFAVRGAHADYLLSEQPWHLAFGRRSLLERFVELDGKILLLGSDHDAVTFLHYAEHIAGIPGQVVVPFKVPVLENGVKVWRDCSEVDSGNPSHPNWPEDLFRQVVDGFLERTGNTGGKVGDSMSFVMSATALLPYALDEMRRRAIEGSPRE